MTCALSASSIQEYWYLYTQNSKELPNLEMVKILLCFERGRLNLTCDIVIHGFIDLTYN